MDFTIKRYHSLLYCIKTLEYRFILFKDFHKEVDSLKDRTAILRHDVDLLPQNSLNFARIQASLGIKGSYYFRIVPQSFDPRIIEEIASLGHEIGYHYETMDSCKGNVDAAYEEFCRNLEKFRKLVPVSTICMHGSPRSPYDNKDIWKKYSYRDLGIIGEPYFDIDFTKVAYYTDTARMWDGHKYSVRDRVSTTQSSFPVFHSTQQIIQSFQSNSFPKHAMFTFHPQRWTNQPVYWLKELAFQNSKNLIKKLFFVKV